MTPAEQFFRALYRGQTGRLELRTFDHPAANTLRNFVEVEQGTFDISAVEQFLSETSRLKLGAFFGVALRTQASVKARKGSGEFCQTLTALFVDADFKHLGEEETRRRLWRRPPRGMCRVYEIASETECRPPRDDTAVRLVAS